MKIEDVIQKKGDSHVATIRPTASVADLVKSLADLRIGALVVSTDGLHIDGIVSERDIVRGLAQQGADLLSMSVASLMTQDVYTAAPESSVEDAARSMTDHRIRHMPVLVAGELVGLVSIGDVVKNRIDQLTEERDHLIGYLQS